MNEIIKLSQSHNISHLPSKHQVVDMLTKSLYPTSFQENLSKMGLLNIHTPSWKGLLMILRSFLWPTGDNNFYCIVIFLFYFFVRMDLGV